MDKAEIIREAHADHKFKFADGFNNAILGVENNSLRVIYSVKQCVEILMERDKMDEDEAMEFLQFNSIGAYIGEKTPIWCYDDFG